MNRIKTNWLIGPLAVVIVIAGLLSPIQRPVAASSGGAFQLSWFTVDGGGGRSSGGQFEVSGTIGQGDHQFNLTGGSFEVDNGFWSGLDKIQWDLFLPVIVR